MRRKEIKDVLAYLKLIEQPGRRSQSEKNHQYPSRGIGEKTLEKIEAFSRERGDSLYEGLKQAIGEDWLAPAVTTKAERVCPMDRRVPERSRGLPLSQLTLAVLRQDGVSAEM